MAVHDPYSWRTRPGGTSISSLALLAIFVAAAALMVAIVVMRPGLGSDSETAAPVLGPGVEAAAEGAPAGATAAEAVAAPVEGAQPVEDAAP